MATTTDLITRADASLRELTAELDFLPEMAAQWEREPQDNRLSYSLEWDELMDRLAGLERACCQGLLTSDQQVRLQHLLRKLEDMLPISRRLELAPPPVSLGS